ncbi:C40 family peptidase [Arthrobacter castelli]|uniref:C40 family peptidase n=1 Tax=Arthrobacter castelli TaxID=271431 RepID=UPI000417C272|nr:C40 family peptidase [Arthrobacter castelli]
MTTHAGSVGRPAAVVAATSGMLLAGAGANAASHTVQQGDTLSKIAAQHGVSLQKVFQLNNMGWNDSVIYPGERIQYSTSGSSSPSGSSSSGSSAASSSASTHTVQAGDTLGRIASRYGVSLQKIFQLNNMGMNTIIYPGDVIQVSGGGGGGSAAQAPSNDRGVTTVGNDVQRISSSGIAATAKSYTGVPYVWGGESLSGWDCSGFVQYVYAQHGIDLPRVYQWHDMNRTSNPQPGDVVVQNGGSHVGIYLGGGKMISALNPSQGTMVHNVSAMPVVGYYTI